MIAEIGLILLINALILSGVNAIGLFLGVYYNNKNFMSLEIWGTIGSFILISSSFFALIWLFIADDFSAQLVVQNSHSMQPFIYKIAASWGNHEGSLLLWIWVLSFFALLIGLFGHKIDYELRMRTVAVQNLIIFGFLLFLIFASNPFARVMPAALQGQSLNPLLQDPGLAMHPPLLYLGFVGVSIVYSFAVAGLIGGRIDHNFARSVRPFALMAWVFLTAGIVLGSRWAYYELGWGGFWFWDPVENASFMPWLVMTALVHSIIVLERRGALASWTILLAICGFCLSLIGTFLVRSGVLSSVHAFATDPTRGIYILFLLIISICGSLGYYAYRAPKLAVGNLFQPISKEGGLLLNNYLLGASAGVVLLGTLYPLMIEAVNGDKITVGPPFYNLAFNPIMVVLAMLLGIGLFLGWKRSPIKHLWSRLQYVVAVAVIVILLVLFVYDGYNIGAALACGLGVWVIGAAMREFVQSSWHLPVRHWRLSSLGSLCAHAGLGVGIIGIAGASLLAGEALANLKIGDKITYQNHVLTLSAINNIQGENWGGIEAVLQDENGNSILPQKRNYVDNRGETTEAGIHSRPWVDVYAAIGDVKDDTITIRLYVKPFAMLLWLGGAIMVFGGILSLVDLRNRFAIPKS